MPSVTRACRVGRSVQNCLVVPIHLIIWASSMRLLTSRISQPLSVRRPFVVRREDGAGRNLNSHSRIPQPNVDVEAPPDKPNVDVEAAPDNTDEKSRIVLFLLPDASEESEAEFKKMHPGVLVLERIGTLHQNRCSKWKNYLKNGFDRIEENSIGDTNVKWLYFVEESSYIRPDVLEAQMNEINDASEEGMMVGPKLCPDVDSSDILICEGTGVALSKNAAGVLLREENDDFTCDESHPVFAFSHEAQRVNVSLRDLPGTYPKQLSKTCYDHITHKGHITHKVDPVAFGQIPSAAAREYLHELFDVVGTSKVTDEQLYPGYKDLCLRHYNRAVCVEKVDQVPWVRDHWLVIKNVADPTCTDEAWSR